MGSSAVRVGLLGCGNVGSALVRLLTEDAARIERRTQLRLELGAVAVRSATRERLVPIPPGTLTTDPGAVVNDPNIDVVVEAIGGIEPARALILAALKARKPVVTANKELLANCGAELFEAATLAGVDLLFEAAVAGAIPLIRPLRESLAGEHITRVMGIVNGTTNFILTRMAEGAETYHEALAQAQSLGYAERDPTADVEGFDAAAKAAILANVAFGVRVVAGDVYREGIADISPRDIAVARHLGFTIKLLAIVDGDNDGEDGDGPVMVRVHPAMLPTTHPLASVRDSFNAVFIEGTAAGALMLLGRGAGGLPTASAVLGDLIDAAHNALVGGAGRTVGLHRGDVRSIDTLRSAYYLSLDVADRAGVLRAVAGVLGDHHVSIRLMEQEETTRDLAGAPPVAGQARLMFITHPALEGDMQTCLHDLRRLDVVEAIGSLIRVVGDPR